MVYDILTEDEGIRKRFTQLPSLKKNAQGNPLKITGVIKDITVQKKADEALIKAKENAEESEALLKNITDNIPAYIAAVDSNTLNYTFVNKNLKIHLIEVAMKLLGKHIRYNREFKF